MMRWRERPFDDNVRDPPTSQAGPLGFRRIYETAGGARCSTRSAPATPRPGVSLAGGDIGAFVEGFAVDGCI